MLLERLEPVVRPYSSEIIFVDDSEDNTPQVITAAGQDYVRPVRMIHRDAGNRAGGLGSAVIAGIRAARGLWVVVMDADLQHPPEVIPQMLRAASEQNLDMVLANRYCEGGSAGSFTPLRLITSKGSTLAAKAMFPRRLHGIDDPMTGYFMVRRDALNLETLRPNGYKILLEIVARTPQLKIGSVPFVFGERFSGESKASLKEGIRFLNLLCNLRFGAGFTRFAQFTSVGISGLVVNTAVLALATEFLGIYYMLSLLFATQVSTFWNFTLSERMVFGSGSSAGARGRAARFFVMNNIALLARGPMVFGLTSMLGFNYLVSNVFSMLVLLVVRYAVSDTIIWKTDPISMPVMPAAVVAEGEATS